jgi:precorrin 3B synthase CobZ
MAPNSSTSNTTLSLLSQSWDILIIGTGAAALTTALSALTASNPPPRVLLLDKAPQTWAGGNGYFTAAAYRTRHDGLKDLLPLVSNVPPDLVNRVDLQPYPEEKFHDDLQRVTEGRSHADLGKVLVGESLELVRWLKGLGAVEWWLSFRRQAYEVHGRWVFWGGLCLTVPEGGKGLIRGLLKAVEERGGRICYEVDVKEVVVREEGGVEGVEVKVEGKSVRVSAPSVVMCAGGFEASPDLRRQWMGEGWELAHTRGTPYNTGDMLKAAVDLGAKMVGDFSLSGCHSVAWDADSPKMGGDREKTNEFTKSGYPLGLMVNREGKRFVDEGIDLRNYTYARFGRAILEQPGGIAFQIWDADGAAWLRPEEYRDDIVRKIRADSIEELAKILGKEENGLINPDEFLKTMTEYNEAVAAHRSENPDIRLNPAIKDGLSTQSSRKKLALAKSNWSMPINKPPFLAVKVTSGITFTFGGLAIDPETAAVLREDGSQIDGLYCAGEMVGGLFYGNYPGGSGLTAGGVFGRRAGRAAAVRAASKRQQMMP